MEVKGQEQLLPFLLCTLMPLGALSELSAMQYAAMTHRAGRKPEKCLLSVLWLHFDFRRIKIDIVIQTAVTFLNSDISRK